MTPKRLFNDSFTDSPFIFQPHLELLCVSNLLCSSVFIASCLGWCSIPTALKKTTTIVCGFKQDFHGRRCRTTRPKRTGSPLPPIFKFYQITPSTFIYEVLHHSGRHLSRTLHDQKKKKKKEVGSFQRNPQAQAFRMRGEPSASWDATGLGGVAFSLGIRASYLIHKDKAATAALQGNVSQTFTLTSREKLAQEMSLRSLPAESVGGK